MELIIFINIIVAFAAIGAFIGIFSGLKKNHRRTIAHQSETIEEVFFGPSR